MTSSRTAFFWFITQRVVAINYWRFGTPFGPIFRGQESGPISCPETSVRNYDYSLRNNQKNAALVYFAAEGRNHAMMFSVNFGATLCYWMTTLHYWQLSGPNIVPAVNCAQCNISGAFDMSLPQNSQFTNAEFWCFKRNADHSPTLVEETTVLSVQISCAHRTIGRPA